jgi:hypothetical protein
MEELRATIAIAIQNWRDALNDAKQNADSTSQRIEI